MKGFVRITSLVILLLWLSWVYGTWAGILPANLIPLRGGTLVLVFLGTPFLCLFLIGISNREPKAELDYNSTAINAPSRKIDHVLELVQVVLGLWLCSAFVAMLLTDRDSVLQPFVWWTFALYVGLFIAGVLGIILYSIAYGARETFRLYRDAMKVGGMGPLGRFLWAIYFIIAFIGAVLLTRR